MRYCRSDGAGCKQRRARVVSEAQVLRSAYRRLLRIKPLHACCYVPLLGRCVDLAFVQHGYVSTVEFKLRDWRRGLEQAADHRLAADYAYVCMPVRRVSPRMRASFQSAGVGLLFYVEDSGWPFDLAVGARRSSEVWRAVRQELMDYIMQKTQETKRCREKRAE